MKKWWWLLGLSVACEPASLRREAEGDAAVLVPADAGPQRDAGQEDDAAVPEAGTGAEPYAHVPPPKVDVVAALQPATWKRHYAQDLAPYWLMGSALGAPEGNFPTFRGMDGSVRGSTDRYPRMLSRQTYAYSMGYLLTGAPELLRRAKAGADWIREHARDPAGGCHAQLTLEGNAKPGPKTTQDTAYCALGLAAYFFVTRDPEVEADVLALRDFMFERLWSDKTGRMIDGLSADLSTPYDVENDGGAELVAQLDPMNGFLLLTQPVLSETSRRTQALADLERLARVLVDQFFRDGTFWGVENKKGQYGTRHVDFGHTLKAYWMILEVDKRLPDHPFHDFVQSHVHDYLARAYDAPNGRWGKRPVSDTDAEWGSDWWIYAEADQISATLDFIEPRYLAQREKTQAHWLTDFVDPTNHEVFPDIKRDGSPGYSWSADSTAKCNEWKNGYHSTEHALVSYLTASWLVDKPAELYFAVPASEVETFVARPYFFHGKESKRVAGEMLEVPGEPLREVRVSFSELF